MQGESVDQIIIDDPCVPGVPISENPQNRLQFENGVLQQMWVVSEYRDGLLLPISVEWRDVPHVDAPKSPGELAQLIKDCIDAKTGDKEFALFYLPGWAEHEWLAQIGNPVSVVMLGESAGEYQGRGVSPEAACVDLLAKIKEAANASR